MRHRAFVARLAGPVALAVACVVSQAWGGPVTITDLGTLAGGTMSTGNAINAQGQVSGISGSAAGNRAMLSDGVTMLDLGTLGGNQSAAYGINSAGQVVGRARTPSPGSRFHAFLWTSGGLPTPMLDLGALPGGNTSTAYAINGSGEVVGESNFLNSPFTFHAFRWTSGGGMVDLGTLAGGSSSIAFAINESGQVAGEADDVNGTTRAFIWDSVGGIQDIGTLPGGTTATARGINAQGQVVGWSDVTGGATRAFLWDPVTGFTDLGTLPGGGDSFAMGINDLGQVVGQVFTATGSQAFVWDAVGGMQALPALTGATESIGISINNAGQITGESDSATQLAHAVRWQLNRGPSAQAGSASTPQDTPVAVTLGGSDPDGDPLGYTIVTPPVNGSLSGVAPSLVYTPNPGWSGSDAFAFTVNDGALTSAPATVSLTVVAAGPLPEDLAGRIKGHGHLEGHHHFGLDVGKPADGAPFGRLHYWHARATTDHGRPHWQLDRFVATTITAATFSDDPAITPSKKDKVVVDSVAFSGTGRWNGVDGYTFEAQAADAGEPGRGRDTFAIVIKAPDGTEVANVGGTLAGGNVQSVRVKPLPVAAAATNKKK